MNTQILIEPMIDGEAHGTAVQAKSFHFGLRISNKSNSPSDSFTISRIIMQSAQGQDIHDDFDKRSFLVDSINPGEERVIDVGRNGQFMYGLTSVTVTINPSVLGKPIMFLQKNPFTESLTEIGQNRWVDFLYIKGVNEDLQEKTNIWLVRLTWIMVVISILLFLQGLGVI